ncbi:MAG: hypothetical protein H6Q60_418 [Oscillospiraceae bacterium]|nr:hypothetical protein [Oscillospiraceae bacterium]
MDKRKMIANPERTDCSAMAKHRINELVHCEFCGEDYSSTYRRCPFCNNTGIVDEEPDYRDDFEDDFDDASNSYGGRRLTREHPIRGRRQILRIIGSIVAVGLLITIVLLVLSIIRPLMNMTSNSGETSVESSGTTETDIDDIDTSAASGSKDIQQSGSSTDTDTQTEDQDSDTETSSLNSSDTSASSSETKAETTQSTSKTGTTAASSTATNLTLSKDDFTLFSAGETCTLKATLTPSGSSGTVTWESENTSVATVSSSGKVTAVGKGSTTITAMLDNGATQSCVVRCSFTGSSSSANSSVASSANSALNKTDFTLLSLTETYQLKVTDYTGSVTWSSSNTSVAKVSSSGTVSAVANGTCKVTATLEDGKTLTCIVRVNQS